jgi:hypothetical protein
MMKRAVFGLIAASGGGTGGGAKADARDFMCEVANSIVIITGYTGSALNIIFAVTSPLCKCVRSTSSRLCL